jgi:hypothetical protein
MSLTEIAECTEKEFINIIQELRSYLCVLRGLCEIYIFGCGLAALCALR